VGRKEIGGKRLLHACTQFVSVLMVEVLGVLDSLDGFTDDAEMVGADPT
jgi:hypothetical protein